jgi:hypothetical protein
MATAKDILLNDSLDYIITNGDFTVGECDEQSTILILNTNTGSWKFNPVCGAGLKKYQGSTDTQAVMKREISLQLEADGFRIKSVIVKDYSDFYIDHERVF